MNHMMKVIGACTAVAMSFATSAYAGGHGPSWKLDAASSKVAFGSVKKDKVGEVHTFSGLSGTVSDEGKVSVEIDLASVETNIDIRNQRMLKFVLNAAPKATLNAKIDIKELNALKPGDTTDVDVEGTLNFNGASVDVEATMFVARLSEKKVLVTTDEMLMMSTSDLGIDAGVDKLMQLAKLPGITRVTPVTLRFVFTQ